MGAASTCDCTDGSIMRDSQHAASLTVGAAAAEAPGLKLLQAAARRERRNSFSEIYSWEGLQVIIWDT
jgi:hypothetical protein